MPNVHWWSTSNVRFICWSDIFSGHPSNEIWQETITWLICTSANWAHELLINIVGRWGCVIVVCYNSQCNYCSVVVCWQDFQRNLKCVFSGYEGRDETRVDAQLNTSTGTITCQRHTVSPAPPARLPATVDSTSDARIVQAVVAGSISAVVYTMIFILCHLCCSSIIAAWRNTWRFRSASCGVIRASTHSTIPTTSKVSYLLLLLHRTSCVLMIQRVDTICFRKFNRNK